MADAAPLASLPAAEGNEVEVLRRWRRSREEAMQLWAAEMLGWNGKGAVRGGICYWVCWGWKLKGGILCICILYIVI